MESQINNFDQMPLAERLLMVEDLWDSIARSSTLDLPIPQWQKDELLRRKKKYLENPDSAMPWSDVKRTILESKE